MKYKISFVLGIFILLLLSTDSLAAKANKAYCSLDTECNSGNCNNRFCCSSGQCGQDYECFSQGSVQGDYVCLSGSWKKAEGIRCSTNAECASGRCTNGYCCGIGQCGYRGRCFDAGTELSDRRCVSEGVWSGLSIIQRTKALSASGLSETTTTSTSRCQTTSTTSTTSQASSTTIPNAQEFPQAGKGPILTAMLIAPAFAYMISKKK